MPVQPARKLTCILNGAAGSQDPNRVTALLRDAAAEHGADIDIVSARPGTDLTAIAARAIESGSTMIVAGGGDGTINAVAAAVVESEAVLGVLPLGTLNHFAKDLGVAVDLEKAIDIAVNGRRIRVDVGEVNGRTFINNSSIGIYPDIVVEREALRAAGYRKWAAFALATARVMRRFPGVAVRVRSDAAEAAFRTPFLLAST